MELTSVNNNLPGWDEFCKLAKAENSNALMNRVFGNSNAKIGDVTRLNARYRLAKDVKSIEYETLELRTAEGYTALMKAFLACNALESYMKLIGHNSVLQGSKVLFSDVELDKLAKEIGILDKKRLFFGFIQKKADAKSKNLKEILNAYVECKPYNPISLLVGIRHIFAHGILTPNASKDNVSVIIKIAYLLASNALNKIASEFALRIYRD